MIGKAGIAIWVSVACAAADTAADKLTAAGIVEFSAAYQAWDGSHFGKAAELFHQAEVKTPTSAIHPYWHGTALFHQMLQLKSTPNHKATEAAMDAALASLEIAVKLDPHHAESHALLGTLYGMKIHGGMFNAIRYGPSVQKHQELALKHGPSNPRVRYLLGTGQFHTAKDAATRREALNTLLAAEKLFKAEAAKPVKPLEPHWGYSSCLTFIAHSYELLGQKTEAEIYYHKALAAHPEDHAAKEGMARIKHK